jgi:DNA-binding HxlR family transcriptional regulator
MTSPLVRRSPIPASECNLAKSFELIGERWTLMILRSALYGVCRFDDFQTDLGIPRSVLSNRLAGLVESEVMEKREYREDGQRMRVEYPLTAMGKTLALPFIAMTEWGDRWLSEGKQPPLSLRSKVSGQRVNVAWIDERGKAVAPNDVETIVHMKKAKKPPTYPSRGVPRAR